MTLYSYSSPSGGTRSAISGYEPKALYDVLTWLCLIIVESCCYVKYSIYYIVLYSGGYTVCYLSWQCLFFFVL